MDNLLVNVCADGTLNDLTTPSPRRKIKVSAQRAAQPVREEET
jgi:hypothetical protein